MPSGCNEYTADLFQEPKIVYYWESRRSRIWKKGLEFAHNSRSLFIHELPEPANKGRYRVEE